MTNAIIIEVLSEAVRILKMSEWTQHALARDAKGRSCSISGGDAVAFCLGGALIKAWRALDGDNEDLYHKFFQNKFSEILREKYNYKFTYTRWNDRPTTSKEDVMTLLHDAIDSMRAEQFEVRLGEKRLFSNGAPGWGAPPA